jgi:predicted ATPase
LARNVEDVELPRSIQGLIAARLDGLPEDEKAVLQDAAVVGRVFWVGAVAELAGRSVGEVRDALGRLRVKELVLPHEPSSFSDEHEFSFRHNLSSDGPTIRCRRPSARTSTPASPDGPSSGPAIVPTRSPS